MRLVPYLLVSLAVACTPELPPPAAPVDLAIPPLGSASAPREAPPSRPTSCTARLSAEAIQTAEGCQLDERISRGAGELSFPCNGDGAIEAVFGEHRFEGRLTNGLVNLAPTPEPDWQDNCRWETQQDLRGKMKVEGGSAQTTKLYWTYSEKPIRGERCYSACVARAAVVVEGP